MYTSVLKKIRLFKDIPKIWNKIYNQTLASPFNKHSQFLQNSSYCTMATPNTQNVIYLEIPEKSETDKKHYRPLLLSNGMLALIVSDPTMRPNEDSSTSSSYDSTGDSCAEESGDEEASSSSQNSSEDSDSDSSLEGDEKLAACAVLVDVGSFSEPKKYQGLAHFVEHMIFMGSEKYPTENAFDAHIKKCGGFDNANTECEETLFYFEVSEEHLDSSMDYFSALLKAPLMKKEAMTRERDAIESEFLQTLLDDEARRDQLLASLATPGYPHNTFTWGNLKTLKENVNDDDLHKELHNFCKRHYSAHRMVVVVQARLPIEELEDLVVKHFSGIASNSQPGRDFSHFKYEEAFQEQFYKKVFFVKPVENVCKLELSWVLPPMIKQYICKPDHFIAYLIGYEGKGSLCAYLRKKLWGLELLAGIDETGFDNNSIYSLFNLCIYLTDEGFKHLDEVLVATFAFIKLFTHCGSLEELYTELQLIEANNFRFESQKAAFDNVQELVIKTKYYPPKHILTGAELYFEYNEEKIQNIIRHLNEFKFNMMITSQRKFDGISYNSKERWFGTEYTCIDMPQKWTDMWNNSKPMPELFLPQPNRLLTTDFRILWIESGKPELAAVPKKILQTDVCELWFRQDDKFNLPDAFMYFYFVSPLLRQSAKNDVICAIYTQLVKFGLNEELYPATVAGLDYQFYSAEKGVVLKVSGYNEKLHLLVDIITKGMVTMEKDITEEQLATFKTHQKKAYFNALIKPKKLNKDLRLSIVENIRWPIIDKYKALNDIKLEDMLSFIRCFTDQLYVQALMQGNLSQELAHNVMNSVLSTLNCHKIVDTKFIENRTVQMPQGSHYLRCRALNNNDTNTIITNFYQIGPCSVRIEGILDLLMMFVEEPLFDNLRTKEQLGYYVGSSVRINYGIAGYSISINSQECKFDAAHVEERIECFRGKMLQILEKMPEDDFDHVKESLIKIKLVCDMSLYEEVQRNWGEITCEDYLFDRRKKEVEIIRALTKQDIIDFCLNNERTNLRKLSVQVIGHKKTASANANDAENNINQSKNEKSEANKQDNEELYNSLANKLDVVFIPREGDATTIVDMKDFKENLFVYPITKTKLEESPDNMQVRSHSPATELIEEC